MRKIIIIAAMLAVAGCATGTVPFNPGKKQGVEPQYSRANTIFDGMNCDDYCRLSGNCSLRQRVAAQGSKVSGCKVYLHEMSLDSIRRSLRRESQGARRGGG